MLFLYLIVFSLSVFFAISLYNFVSAPEIKESGADYDNQELISVLIPARNEENNIKNCLNSILEQDYHNKEILVLDDLSTDNTFVVASSFSEKGVQILKGKELQQNWIGKNWACHQLSLAAKGNYLLFVDADVILKPGALTAVYAELKKNEAVLISIFPTQIINSLGEYLIVPLMNWLLLTFLPLTMIYGSGSKSFVAANGQFMFWKKDAYFSLDGHLSVSDKVVEDMELARKCKSNGLKIKTLLGGQLIYCRMYNSFKDALKGFQKNFYRGFDLNPFKFFIVISFLFVVFVSPIMVFSNELISYLPFLLAILTRTLVSIKSKQNWFINILLHPFQMVIMFIIGISSVIKSKYGSLEWKDRRI